MSTGHLSFVLSTTRRQLSRSMPGQVRPGTDGRGPPRDRRPSRSTDGSRQSILDTVPRLVPSGSRLHGLRQHRLRGVQGGRRPPCSGCVVVCPASVAHLGARSMLDARSFMISTLRTSHEVDFAAAVAHARLHVSRIKLIGCLAAPPAATRLPRAPSFHRPPSSRRGEALCVWERRVRGGGRVGFAGDGLF